MRVLFAYSLALYKSMLFSCRPEYEYWSGSVRAAVFACCSPNNSGQCGWHFKRVRLPASIPLEASCTVNRLLSSVLSAWTYCNLAYQSGAQDERSRTVLIKFSWIPVPASVRKCNFPTEPIYDSVKPTYKLRIVFEQSALRPSVNARSPYILSRGSLAFKCWV